MRFVEDLDGLVYKAVLAVLFDQERHRFGGEREGEGVGLGFVEAVNEVPHGLEFASASEGSDEFFELERGGVVVGLS